MDKPIITGECVKTVAETRFIRVYDLQYAPGKHYFDATRRDKDEIFAVLSEEEFKKALPDAVSCILIVKLPDEDPKLLMSYEFRYPAGQFLLSPPAGLIDDEDKDKEDALILTAKREIQEETGIVVKDTDSVKVVSPCLFSTPGMSDESNALVCVVTEIENLDCLTQEGCVGTECFDGFELIDEMRARKILSLGTDEKGMYFSVYTWMVLSYFVSGAWR